MTAETHYDAVVIGGGLAGVAAASMLNGKRTLLLEKEEWLGGRVLTIGHGDLTIDIGACFACDPAFFPASGRPDSSQLVRELGDVGIFMEGKVYTAPTVHSCLRSMPFSSAERGEIIQFMLEEIAWQDLGKRTSRIVNALFQSIHSAHISRYAPEIHPMAFTTYAVDHWRTGNAAVVDAHRKATNAEIVLGATVNQVEESEDGVAVHFSEYGRPSAITARGAIVATPASVTRLILRSPRQETADLLEGVAYGAFTVVALVFEKRHIRDWRYLCCVDTDMSAVIQQTSIDEEYSTLLVYYGDAASRQMSSLDENGLEAKALADIRQVQAGSHPLVHRRTKRWPIGSTILDSNLMSHQEESPHRASKHVYLAGDYLQRGRLSYGMVDAIRSGLTAGRDLAAFLA